MICLYICLAGFNFGLSWMSQAPDAERAWFYLFLMRPFLFFLPPCFLWTALSLAAGRPRTRWSLGPAFALAVFMTAAAGWAYLTGSRLFIRAMRELPWGFVPLAGPGAAAGLGALFLYCLPLAFFVLVRAGARDRKLAGVSSLVLIGMFLLWWAGLLSNALSVAGVNFFPLGSVTDAVMSFVITAYLHRRQGLDLSSHISLRAAGLLASLCPGALVTYLLLEFVLPDRPVGNALAGLATAAVTLLAFLRWFQPGAGGPSSDGAPAGDQPLFVRLQNEYGLTYQEARICEELRRGLPRAEILARLAITSGTFRNHLSEIYRKTVDRVETPAATSRDKWQRLTVFLHNAESASSVSRNRASAEEKSGDS